MIYKMIKNTKRSKLIAISLISIMFCIGIYSVNAFNRTMTTKTSFLNEKDISIKFDESFNINGEIMSKYIDKNKNEYILNSNEKLTGYYKNIEIDDLYLSTADEKVRQFNLKADDYIDVSKNILKSVLFAPDENNIKNNNINNTSLEEYSLISSGYIESYKEFYYTYAKKINGYVANDTIMINLNVNGEVTSFISYQQGKFDDYRNIVINKNEVSEFVKTKMLENYNCQNYTIENEIIDFKDNELVLAISVGFRDNIGSTSDILYYKLSGNNTK